MIVVLYVFDNDTNPVIKISCFVGLAIECWKVKRSDIMSVTYFPNPRHLLKVFPENISCPGDKGFGLQL